MPKSKRKEDGPKTIKRKIFFYRINAGVHTDTGVPKTISFGPVLTQLNAMAFDENGRYLPTEDGKQLCCWTETSGETYRLRLATIRRGSYPPVENHGTLSPLVLASGGGLAEITHLILFPGGICGAEFNFYGPRPSQLSFYFALKLKEFCPGFRLNPLVRPDLMARLAALTDIKLLDMKVRASYASVIEQANHDLGAAFSASINAVAARPQDELELKFIRKKNKSLAAKAVPTALLDGLRKLAQKPDLREQVSTFKITGAGVDTRVVDVLSEQFTAEKTVLPSADKSGAVDSSSMFTAIEQVYEEVKDNLTSASELEFETAAK